MYMLRGPNDDTDYNGVGELGIWLDVGRSGKNTKGTHCIRERLYPLTQIQLTYIENGVLYIIMIRSIVLYYNNSQT